MRLLRRIASEVLGEELSKRIWGGMDVVGDIAIIRKPFDVDLEALSHLAEEMLKRIPWIRSVWASVSPVQGEHRLRELSHLAGEKRTETIYREHGCAFKVDIASVYVSPRLSHEHMRVAKLVGKGEGVINMFAGAGLFSIIIAVHSSPSRVFSIDINERAYRLMEENVRLNRVEGRVIPILGDASDVVEDLRASAHRILMPLPELAYKLLPKAVEALEREGWIHVYDFVRSPTRASALELAEEIYGRALSRLESVRSHRILGSRVVRSVGPRRYQVVLDIWVRRSSE